jgi:hypothetical protein
MAGQWYVMYKNGKQSGPMTPAAVKILVSTGQLNADDKIRPEEQSNWQIAGNVAGLFPPVHVQQIPVQVPIQQKEIFLSSVTSCIILSLAGFAFLLAFSVVTWLVLDNAGVKIDWQQVASVLKTKETPDRSEGSMEQT